MVLKTSGVRLVLAGMTVVLGLVLPATAATAAAQPKIYGQARALPTRSGQHAKIVLYTKRVTSLKVSIDGESRRKAKRFAVGCGKLRCEKWRIYAARGENECYDLTITGRRGKKAVTKDHTVCEPFRNGEI